MGMSFYQELRQKCKIESFYTTGKQKKIDCFHVDGYCNHCKTVIEAMACYYLFCSCQETRPLLSEQDTERQNQKRKMDELRQQYIKKGYNIQEMWDCECWEHIKTDSSVENHFKTNFPYKRPLSTDSLLKTKRNGSLFGYVQCNLIVPDELKPTLSSFPPIFKNFDVCCKDIGEYMKKLTEENDLLKNPQRMLISSFKLQIGTIITPLLNFYLSHELQCTKNYRFVE